MRTDRTGAAPGNIRFLRASDFPAGRGSCDNRMRIRKKFDFETGSDQGTINSMVPLIVTWMSLSPPSTATGEAASMDAAAILAW